MINAVNWSAAVGWRAETPVILHRLDVGLRYFQPGRTEKQGEFEKAAVETVGRPSVGSEPTLVFWRVFLCYRRDEPIQQHASQEFVCNGEQSDASIV